MDNVQNTMEMELLLQYGIDVNSRSFSIIGPIEESTIHYIDTRLRLLETMNSEPITVNIHSEGGDSQAGMAVADRIRNSACHIITYNHMSCFSAAVVIFAAGHTRLSNPYGRFMVHEFSQEPSEDKTSHLKRAIKEQEWAELNYCKAIADYTSTDAGIWHQLMQRKTDCYFGTQKAFELGLLTERK